MRGDAFIWSRLLPKPGTFNGLMHVTDWLPTIMHAVTGQSPQVNEILYIQPSVEPDLIATEMLAFLRTHLEIEMIAI